MLIIDSLPVGGRAFGGIRRMAYATRGEACADAARLARAMSHKCILAQLPAGGAKMVLWDPEDRLGEDAYDFVGEVVEALDGDYVCGPDVGTDERRMAAVRRRTRWANPVGNDPGARTAQGVLAGMRGAASVAFGSPSLAGKEVRIHGLGSVGLALARRLLALGASVRGWDVNAEAVARAAEDGVTVAATEGALLEGPMDIFAPCAVGGVVDDSLADRLATAVVCGSANNVLASPASGARLFGRGILFAPDIIVNAGAVIEGVWTVLAREETALEGTVDAHVEAIEARCRELLVRAQRRAVPPEVCAIEEADAALVRRAEAHGAVVEGS